MYVLLGDQTRVDSGGEVCDLCFTFVEVPIGDTGVVLWKMDNATGMWIMMATGQFGTVQREGQTFVKYRATWRTSGTGEHNWWVPWKAVWMHLGEQQTLYGGFTPSNTVVSASPGTILYDPDDQEHPERQHPQIEWSIAHKDYYPSFDVTVTILDLTGYVLKTITAAAGLGMGAVVWDGSTDFGPASKGVYALQVKAEHHPGPGILEHLCKDLAFAELVSGASFDPLHMHPDLDQVQFWISCTLSRDVATCLADVYNPDLGQCLSDYGLPTGAGTFRTDEFVRLAVAGSPPRYYLVVKTMQTEPDGLNNRSQSPKPGVRRGVAEAYLVVAVGWRDPQLLNTWARTEDAFRFAGYEPGLVSCPCPDKGLALGGLGNAAIWAVNQHADASWHGIAPHALLYGGTGGGHVFDHDSPQVPDPNATPPFPGIPPGYSPQYDLNVHDYPSSWRQLLFVAYFTCAGGEVDPHGDLLQATVNAGADSALGFLDTIWGGPQESWWTTWTDTFWWETCVGDASLEDAALAATDATIDRWGAPYGWDQWRLVNPGLHLVPARYGW